MSSPPGGERVRRRREQLLHDVLVPVVQDVRKEVDVVVRGQRIGQHVAGDDVDASGEPAAFDGAPGDPIDRRLFEHRRRQRRDVRRRSSTRRCRIRRRCPATGGGPRGRGASPAPGRTGGRGSPSRRGTPRQTPPSPSPCASPPRSSRLAKFAGRPVRSTSIRSRAIGRSLTLGKYGPRNHGDEATRCSRAVPVSRRRGPSRSHELHGDKQRGHHVDRPALEPEVRATSSIVPGCASSQVKKSRPVSAATTMSVGVQLVAHAIERERVGVRSTREVGHGW